MTEKGMFRKNSNQIDEDMTNQEAARNKLEKILNLCFKPQHVYSVWDWEIYEGDAMIAIAEYRRRFVNFGKYPDFQFSKKKFDTMKLKAETEDVNAYMVVEFNDGLKYFVIEGEPDTQIMQRRGEVRTEEVVVIPNEQFKDVKELENNL